MEEIGNLKEWFNNLDLTWKRLFKQQIDINHKPSEDEIQEILNLTELDCSNSYIISVDPLKYFKELRSLNCSKTNIKKIDKLSELKNLEKLDVSDTQVSTLMSLANLKKLEVINCNSTMIDSLEGLNSLENLTKLDCSNTNISDLEPLKYLLKIKNLNISSTNVSSCIPIKYLINSIDLISKDTPYEWEEKQEMLLRGRDELFTEAARIIVSNQQGSTSLLQRRLKLGYNRVGRIIDQLERTGIIGPFQGSKARDVLIQDQIILELFLKSEFETYSDFKKSEQPSISNKTTLDINKSDGIPSTTKTPDKKKGFWKWLLGK